MERKRGFVGSVVRACVGLAVLACVGTAAIVGLGFVIRGGSSAVSGLAEMVGGSDQAAEIKIASKEPDAAVPAVLLVMHYKANEVAADQRFKGKTLQVTGIVESIKKDMLNQPYLTLAGNGPLAGVQCYFAKSHEGELAQIQTGMGVSVKGRCDGLMMNVLLRGCVLTK